MADESPDLRIEQYLSGQLSDRERTALEAELADSEGLRQELQRAELIDRALREPNRRQLRQMLGTVRREVGPVTPPRISIWDRLAWTFGRWWWLGLLMAVLLSGIWYAWSNRTCPTDAVIDNGFLEPTLIHVQAGSITRSDLAYRASRYYGAADSEALEKMSQESRDDVSWYYLAHDYLRRDDYSRAESTFGRLLEQPEALLQLAEYQDLNALRFNRLLSELGMHNDPTAALPALEALLARPDIAGTETELAAQALAAELGNDWRWWACP